MGLFDAVDFKQVQQLPFSVNSNQQFAHRKVSRFGNVVFLIKEDLMDMLCVSAGDDWSLLG